MNQAKRQRFVRIAETRTQKVLDDLRSLAKCAAPESYEYTSQDVEQILAAIEEGLQGVRDAFAGRNRFTLQTEERPSLAEKISDAQAQHQGQQNNLPEAQEKTR